METIQEKINELLQNDYILEFLEDRILSDETDGLWVDVFLNGVGHKKIWIGYNGSDCDGETLQVSIWDQDEYGDIKDCYFCAYVDIKDYEYMEDACNELFNKIINEREINFLNENL